MGTDEGVTILENIVARIGRTHELDHYLIKARESLVRASWSPVNPADISRMLSNEDLRYATTSQDLLEVVIEQMDQLDTELQGTPQAAEFLWDVQGDRQSEIRRPTDELAISNYVALYLRSRLVNRRIVVNREVHIRRGQATDILIEAVPVRTDTEIGAQAARVVIEVKGCWHKDVRTAIKKQLVDTYLANTLNTAGLYVVAWFDPVKWNWPQDASQRGRVGEWTVEYAKDTFNTLADELCRPGLTVKSCVLNCSLA
jgi:hypothetical protein